MSTPIKQRYDVLVIGGSTAGMSAALAVARSKSSVLLVDSSQPRNAPAHHLHNLLGYDGKQPAEWLTLARQNLEQYKESIQSITGTVTKLDKLVGDDIKDDHLFKAEITIKDQIQTVHARRVVLATGIQDQLEGYPEGVKELWGSLVAHCPFCSGTEYTTASWAVILHPSTGFPTIMAPMFTYMNRQYPMYLFTNANPTLINENDRKAYGANGVIIVDEKIARVSKNEGKAEGVVIHLENGTTHHVSQVYIKPAMRVTPFVEQLNIAINPMTKFVTVDMFGTTSVQGIHAAGDLVEMRQSLSFALAHGTAAGAGAVFSIAQAEWGRKCAAAGVPVAGPPAAAPAPAPAPAAAAAPAK